MGFALCVPEINADAAKKSSKKVIANPNCTTAIGIMALWPLHQKYGLKKVLMSTYQAASGAGQEGMDELFNGAKQVTSGEKEVADNKIFAHPLPFNLIPHIDVFQDNLYTKEEMKVTWECQKIMELPNLPVSCTAVRIPTLRAHAETIVIETEKPINPDDARELLSKAPGVLVNDVPAALSFPSTWHPTTDLPTKKLSYQSKNRQMISYTPKKHPTPSTPLRSSSFPSTFHIHRNTIAALTKEVR